ncbi:MAG: cell division ATPase MinD [Candidatus Diapherotrites archaeon]|nr:cell division ATPase MinD [Candidatus Diapherotrites archaeon]
MTRVIAITSGKGGVGKTTLTANLGIGLALQNQKVLLIDADIAMANLSLHLGMQNTPITLHDVLLGEASIADCVYDGPNKIEIIPSGLSIESYRKIDPTRLKGIVDSIKDKYDFILIDTAAGIERIALAALSASTEVLLVVEPTSSSIADALKTKISAQKLNCKIIGVILNKVFNEKGEISSENISRMLELPVYAIIPFDEIVRRSFYEERAPFMASGKQTPAMNEVNKIVSRLIGIPIKETSTKESFIKRFLNKIFKHKQ